MSDNLIYTLAFIAVNVLIVWFFIKRLKSKSCLTFVYIGVLVFAVNSLAIAAWMFMTTSMSNIYSVATSGESYTATVVSFTSEKRYDSEDDRYYTMYQPTVQFTTKNGREVTCELEFATSDTSIGDTYRVNYDENEGRIITLGFNMVMSFVGALIFCLILTFVSAGILMYAFGYEMDGYYVLVRKVGFVFFVPFLMISFTALLVYGMFYGNDVPWFITLLLGFFAFILVLATVGYLKMIFKQGTSKMTRVSNSRWVGGWDNDKSKK